MTNAECLSRRYKKHKELGLCVWCNEKTYKGTVHCEKHYIFNLDNSRNYGAKNRKKQRDYAKKKRLRFKDEGRCVNCGIPLDVEVDGSHVTCINCIIRGGNEIN